jgi:hypothetical protein
MLTEICSSAGLRRPLEPSATVGDLLEDRVIEMVELP